MQLKSSGTVMACATSLLVAFASLLLATLVFLSSHHPGEPPLLAVMIGIGSLLIGECVRDDKPQFKLFFIVLGAVSGWILAPEIGGRYVSKLDELFSTDKLHFGAVAWTLGGGAIGSIAERLGRAWGSSVTTESRATPST